MALGVRHKVHYRVLDLSADWADGPVYTDHECEITVGSRLTVEEVTYQYLVNAHPGGSIVVVRLEVEIIERKAS